MRGLAIAFRFVAWAETLGYVPTAEEASQRFEVSRATAYRWRRAYCEATGKSINASARKRAARRNAWNQWLSS